MPSTIDTVFVWVSDLDRSLPWYRTLGIEAGQRFGAWQAMSTRGGTRFALHQGERASGPPTAVVAFAVPDLDSEMDRLDGLGITPLDDITDTGAARFTTYADPDGNQIQLLERTA
jgi:catechol 2,3-dioxygenase-like lactoylglutathione lyase family enzyme